MNLPASVTPDLAPSGRLRAMINLGNPVLAQGTAEQPRGVTVDIAAAIGARLGVPVDLMCVWAAKDAFADVVAGRADLAFLANEPARAAYLAFSTPYRVIEGVYVVPAASGLRSPAEVDVPGVRIGVKEGSAYDLFLTRTLEHASIVRGADGVTTFEDLDLEAGAGIRAPVTEFVAARPHLRVIEPAFMAINQAVATRLEVAPETRAWLDDLVAEFR